jgi:DNA polymerase III gamma/tau subunit
MAGVLSDEIDVLSKARRAMPGDYLPSDDEPYMNEAQQDYFRRLLLQWKKSILSASAGTLSRLWQMLMKAYEEVRRAPDPSAAAVMALIRLCYAADLPGPEEALKALRDGEPVAIPAFE